MKKFVPYILCFIAGLLFALGYPSVLAESLLVTPIIGTIILFHYVLIAHSLKARILKLLLFNLGFNLLGFYWISDTLVEFGKLPFVVAFLIHLTFTLIITPHLWIAIIATHLLASKNLMGEKKILVPGVSSLILAIVMTVCEYLVPQQFDVMLGQSWVAIGEHLGFASVGGLPIYSFFSYLLVFETLAIIHKKGASYIHLISIILFVVANPFLAIEQDKSPKKPLHLRLVQANISNFLKLESEGGNFPSVQKVIYEYYKHSTLPYKLNGGKPDLIIWPETAYPYGIYTKKDDMSETKLPHVFKQVSDQMSSELLIGGYDLKYLNSKVTYDSEYNTAFHVSKKGKLLNTYHKHILIPFGETLPFGPLNEYLAKFIDNIAYFAKGERFTLFNLASGHRLISTICYELLKPEFLRNYLNAQDKRPHAIVNLTNDSWYGKTQEPYQHLFLAKWRALEFNLPLIRSTNTGVTSVIMPNGKEPQRLDIGKTGSLDIALSLGDTAPTVYQKYGLTTLFPLWAIYLIFHLLLLKLKNDD